MDEREKSRAFRIWRRYKTFILACFIVLLAACFSGGRLLLKHLQQRNTVTQAEELQTPAGKPAAAKETIHMATEVKGVQQIHVKVDCTGFSPAVMVIERDKPFNIIFEPEDLSTVGEIIYFPVYGGGINLNETTETSELTAASDFVFQNESGARYGYVKVVEDSQQIDPEAVLRDAGNFTPSRNGGCCGRM